MKPTYQGNPCRRGHSGTRYASGHCVQCQVDRANSPEAVAKKNQQRSENRHVAVEYNKKYYAENRDREIKRVKDYYKEKPEV